MDHRARVAQVAHGRCDPARPGDRRDLMAACAGCDVKVRNRGGVAAGFVVGALGVRFELGG
jgi:hypothetical protein